MSKKKLKNQENLEKNSKTEPWKKPIKPIRILKKPIGSISQAWNWKIKPKLIKKLNQKTKSTRNQTH